ncbi:MAG: phage portal protein [Gemmataceae bacterium]|nr:phage portal protein [Gemmataceae bacterium]MDW8244435.1 phage portal protein [Thermogemmata sp.]
MWRRIWQWWKSSRSRPRWPRRSSGGHWPWSAAGWWHDNPVEQLHNFRSWVYVAVHTIAQEAARYQPRVFRSTGPADDEQLPLPQHHPLCRLLHHPNPWLTPWELWYLTVVYLELTGNAYWYVVQAPQGEDWLPVELWIIPAAWVRIIPDARQFVRGYEVAAPGRPAELFTTEEIIHLKYPNPLDPHYGLSPLKANALTIDANTELLKARYQTFQAGPRPGIVLQTEQMLTEQTVARLEERLEAKFQGRESWYRPLVLEQGLRASPWTLTPAEMDFVNSARMTREEIFAIYRVPPPVTGIVENMGLGADIWLGARVMFCEGTIQPKLDLIGQILTRHLASRFSQDIWIEFPDCSPRLRQQQREEDEQDMRWGLRSINEIRRGRGWKPLADPRFDQPLVPRELAPLASVGRKRRRRQRHQPVESLETKDGKIGPAVQAWSRVSAAVPSLSTCGEDYVPLSGEEVPAGAD